MTEKKLCNGCGICAHICPKKAIEMKPDALGFLYPEINKTTCINCGLCDKICPTLQSHDSSYNYQVQYLAGRLKEEEELMKSQSGGAFYVISQEAIQREFIIYGAAFNHQFHVKHIRATSCDERNLLRGSKYVQSDISHI